MDSGRAPVDNPGKCHEISDMLTIERTFYFGNYSNLLQFGAHKEV